MKRLLALTIVAFVCLGCTEEQKINRGAFWATYTVLRVSDASVESAADLTEIATQAQVRINNGEELSFIREWVHEQIAAKFEGIEGEMIAQLADDVIYLIIGDGPVLDDETRVYAVAALSGVADAGTVYVQYAGQAERAVRRPILAQ